MGSISSNMIGIVISVSIIIILIIFLLVSYYTKPSKNNNVNNNINNAQFSKCEINSETNECEIVNELQKSKSTNVIDFTIRDYYIMSSFNSCNNDTYFDNNNLSIESLLYVIKQGVRFLDFEIYSDNSEPIVSTSTSPDNYIIKRSNNVLNFNDVFSSVVNNVFDINSCPNPDDPVFVHLRIKSTNQDMFDNLAKIFNNYRDNYLLGPEYSYVFQDCSGNTQYCDKRNITSLPIKNFRKKILILVNIGEKNKDILDNEKLMEYVNLTTDSLYCRLINNYEMKNTSDQEELINFNKTNTTIVTPDLTAYPNNPKMSVAIQLGIQFTAMNFSNEDINLKDYMKFFELEGQSFVLKPAHLRYKPTFLKVVDDNPEGYSYGPKVVKTNLYSFTI